MSKVCSIEAYSDACSWLIDQVAALEQGQPVHKQPQVYGESKKRTLTTTEQAIIDTLKTYHSEDVVAAIGSPRASLLRRTKKMPCFADMQPSVSVQKTVSSTIITADGREIHSRPGTKHPRKAIENRVRKIRSMIVQDDGTTIVPAKYGPIKLLNLGEVEFKDSSFHNQRYIYPVGYKIIRQFMSTTDPTVEIVDYVCQILRAENGTIKFEVSPLNDPTTTWSGKTSSGAWASIVNTAYEIRNRPSTSTICGPDFYALTSPEIAQAIQGLPNADKCTRYKMQTFITPDDVSQEPDATAVADETPVEEKEPTDLE